MKKVVRLTENDLMRIVKRVISENIDVIDKILDKVGEYGIDSITKSERKILDKYSMWIKSGNPPSEFIVSNTEEIDNPYNWFKTSVMPWDIETLRAMKSDEDNKWIRHTDKLSNGLTIVFTTDDGPYKHNDGKDSLGGTINYGNNKYDGFFYVTKNKVTEVVFPNETSDFDVIDDLLDDVGPKLVGEVKEFLLECYHICVKKFGESNNV